MSDIKMSPYYEDAYPEHERTSCSDENPVNAEVNGHGCLRCNAIFFTKADKMQASIVELEGVIKSRPKHCDHIGEDGEFYNIEDYINKVSSWAFSARKALKENS